MVKEMLEEKVDYILDILFLMQDAGVLNPDIIERARNRLEIKQFEFMIETAKKDGTDKVKIQEAESKLRQLRKKDIEYYERIKKVKA